MHDTPSPLFALIGAENVSICANRSVSRLKENDNKSNNNTWPICRNNIPRSETAKTTYKVYTREGTIVHLRALKGRTTEVTKTANPGICNGTLFEDFPGVS